MLKEQKGITLIALVITIIVLLILAGVSIAMLTGNNGILTQANNAKSDTAVAEAVERINMELNALYGDVLADNLAAFDATADTGTKATVEANLPDTYTATLTNSDKTLTIADSTTGKSGSITITAAGVATISPASK